MTIRSKTPNRETILCLLVGVVLIVASFSHLHLSLLSSVRKPPHWKRVSDLLSLALLAYGTSFLGLGLLSYVLSLKGSSLISKLVNHSKQAVMELRQAVSSSIRTCLASRQDVAWLFAAFAVGLVIRAYFLAEPMRHGESYTFLNFVNQGPFFLFYYPLPNNHVLHTLFVKFSTLIWGAHPVSIRFPAFLFGIASIPLIFCLCRKVMHQRCGILAATAMAVVPCMVGPSVNARGYSLLIFLTLALAFVGMHVVERPSLLGWAVVSLIASLGMLTVPTMVFAIAGVYLWLACLLFLNRKTLAAILREFVIPCAIMTFVFTFILYVPCIVASGGMKSIVANYTIRSLHWKVFFPQVYPHVRAVFPYYFDKIPRPLSFLGMLFLVAGMFGALRKRDWPLLLLLPSMLLGGAAVLAAKHSIPPERIWVYLIPFGFVLADVGLTYLSGRLPRGLQSLLPVLIVALASLYAVSMMSRGTTGKNAVRTFPEAPLMVKYLKPLLSSNDIIHLKRPADETMRFYFWYYGVPIEKEAAVNMAVGKEFFVVKKSRYSIDDLTERPVLKLLDLDDAALYQLLRPEEVRAGNENNRPRKGIKGIRIGESSEPSH